MKEKIHESTEIKWDVHLSGLLLNSSLSWSFQEQTETQDRYKAGFKKKYNIKNHVLYNLVTLCKS